MDLSVEKGGELLLYVLIHSDGTMNRSGTINETFSGPADGSDRGPVIGMTEQPFFDELVSSLTRELSQWIGYHDLGGDGDRCELTLTIALGGRGGRVQFAYGANAKPIPSPVREFARLMIEISDRWLAESGIGSESGPASEPTLSGREDR